MNSVLGKLNRGDLIDFAVWGSGGLIGLLLYVVLISMIGSFATILITLCLLGFIAFIYYSFKHIGLILYPIVIGSYLGGIVDVVTNSAIPVSLFQIFLFIGFAIFVIYNIHNQKFELRYTGVELPVLFFLAFIFLSLTYSPDRANGLLSAVRLIVLLLFAGLILNTVRTNSLIKGLFFTVVIISILLSISSMIELYLNPEQVALDLLGSHFSLDRSTAGGLYQDPNRLAAALILPLGFTFSIINSNLKGKIKFIGFIAFIILIAGLASTFSRSGMLSITVLFITVISFFRNWKFALYSGAGVILVIILIPELRESLILNVERIYDVFFGSTRDDSSNIRVMLGIAGISMFFDSYMMGVGFDGYSEMFTKYYNLQESITVYEPHNIIYELMAELGIIGFLFFVFYVYTVSSTAFKNILSAKKDWEKVIATTLLSSFIGYMVFYQFYGGALTDSNLMLIHALIFTGYFLRQEKITSDERQI